MGADAYEMAESCNKEDTSMPDPSFVIVFKISINTSTTGPPKEESCCIRSSKADDKDLIVSPTKVCK